MFDSSQWKPLQIYCVSRASWLEIYLMTPQPLGINHFLAARSLNSSAPNLVKCQVLRDRSSSGNQSTWTCPGKGIPSMFSYSLDEDGHGEMANRNMATGAWGFPKAAVMTVWSLSVPAQNNSLDTDGKEKVEMNWNMKANFPIMFTVCLAQIRSYSRAQKESCSYSSDHIGHRVTIHLLLLQVKGMELDIRDNIIARLWIWLVHTISLWVTRLGSDP